jgi:transposase
MLTFVTPAQFEFIKPFFPVVKSRRPKKYSDYELFNGLLFLLRTGCQWRNISREYPPWRSIYWFWSKLNSSGCLDLIMGCVFNILHTRDVHTPKTHILITDSQSIDSSECLAKEQKGYDGNKKRNGLKRFVLCDTAGIVCGIFCSTGNADEKRSLRSYLLSQKQAHWNRITLIADKGFESGALQRELFMKLKLSFAPMKRKKQYNISTYTEQLVEQEETQRQEFNRWIRSMRYVVEPVFSWFNRFRRLVRCFERTVLCHTNFCKLASICLGLKRMNF